MQKDTRRARSATIEMITGTLTQGGYASELDVAVTTPAGEYRLAVGARGRSEPQRIAIAVQHQDDSGSAEHKALWHVANLSALQAAQRVKGQFRKTYFVWSGDGWSIRPSDVPYAELLGRVPLVEVLHVDHFCSRARAGQL